MPTVTIGDQTGATHAGAIDAEIYSGSVSANFGSEQLYYIAKYGGADDHRNMVISFTGSTSIAGPVTVSAASFFLYVEDAFLECDIDIFDLLRTFVEGEVTWNEYSSGNSWQTGGARGALDRGATALDTLTIPNATTGYVEFTSAALIAYVESVINASTPIKFCLERNGAGGDTRYTQFRSSDHATANTRPYLQVTYTGGGTGLDVPRNIRVLAAVNRAANF